LEQDPVTMGMLIVLVLIVGGLLVAKLAQTISSFRKELYYINVEIKRSIGAEKVYWRQEKRRLWLSLLPFTRK
jgi:hypothetical protein